MSVAEKPVASPVSASARWTKTTCASAASAVLTRFAAGARWTTRSVAWYCSVAAKGPSRRPADVRRCLYPVRVFNRNEESHAKNRHSAVAQRDPYPALRLRRVGQELVIELQRLGVEVIAVDRYANAPAMQVAHRSHVLDMLDGAALRAVIEQERPHYIVPEIEAIATATLVELEREGYTVIPTARAQLTMNREGIRRLAAEELGLPTSPYRFADTLDECRAAAMALGFPCLVKPVMSSSGKGSRCCAATRHRCGLGICAGRWPRRSRAGHCRRLHRFRLRDHSVDGASCRRNQLLRAGRASPGERRLSGVLAAAAHGTGGAGRGEAHRAGGHRCAGRAWHLRGRTVRQGRTGLVLRDIAAAARHRSGHAGLAGSIGVRLACAGHPGLPIPVIRQLGPAASAVVLVEGSRLR